MSVPLERYRFTVDEYHRMGEAGILHEDDRVELIDGEIVMMTPIGLLHASCVNRLTALLVRAVGDEAIVQVQNPIGVDLRTEPQPDLSLLRPATDGYREHRPQPADVLLVIEVADSSLIYDRHTKLGLYARGGVPEVWIVDLTRLRLEVYRHPTSGGYTEQQMPGHDERVRLPVGDAELAVGDFLP